MRWESSGVVGFDLRPLLEGEMRTAKLKSAYNSLIFYCVKYPYLILTSAYVLAGANKYDQTRIFLK